jgi:hypothetical protein
MHVFGGESRRCCVKSRSRGHHPLRSDRRRPLARVDIRPAQFFGSDIFARGGFDQRRSAQKDGACTFDDDRFIAHGRDVRAARRAGTHHRRDLRNALGRHARLIVEDAPEVIDIGEDFILKRQIRAARIDEVEAGQMIFFGDLLARADVS